MSVLGPSVQLVYSKPTLKPVTSDDNISVRGASRVCEISHLGKASNAVSPDSMLCMINCIPLDPLYNSWLVLTYRTGKDLQCEIIQQLSC